VGAEAPEEIGGKSEGEEDDGNDEILELARVAEGEIDGVGDYGGGGQDKEEWGKRVAGDAVGKGHASGCAAKGKNGSGGEAVEDPADEDDATGELGKFPNADEHCGPDAKSDDSCGRSMKARVDFGELFEKEIVVGHGVEDARRGEDDAVGGAEGGDEDRGGDDFAGPGSEHNGNGSGSNGVTGGGSRRAERDKIGADGEDVKGDKDQRPQEKGARKAFLWFADFSGAVSTELPTFVGPKHGNHGQAKGGSEGEAVLRGAEGGRNFGGVTAERKQNGAEKDDEASLDHRGPVLDVGAFARAPDVDCGDDGDDEDRSEGLSR